MFLILNKQSFKYEICPKPNNDHKVALNPDHSQIRSYLEHDSLRFVELILEHGTLHKIKCDTLRVGLYRYLLLRILLDLNVIKHNLI